LFGSALAIPFLLICSWGQPILDPLMVFGSAAVCGAAGQALRSRWYLPSMLLLLALPIALAYLCEEFGAPASAPVFRNLSPWMLHAGPGLALVLVWPVIALVRRRR
jgi:hypothetical protein